MRATLKMFPLVVGMRGGDLEPDTLDSSAGNEQNIAEAVATQSRTCHIWLCRSVSGGTIFHTGERFVVNYET